MSSVEVSTLTTLSEYADALLQVCENSLSLTDAGVPPRVFLAPSVPAIDCEMLCVYISALTEAPTSPLAPIEETALRGKFGFLTLVSYVIDVVRCSANPESLLVMPTPAALTSVAHTIQDDAWALWNGVRHAHADGDIFDQCLGVHFDGITPIADQGGFVGVEFRLRASIPGIPNT